MKQKSKRHVVVTTGGSGGHISPAEGIISALVADNVHVSFITDKRGQVFQGLKEIPTFRIVAEHVTGRSLARKMVAAIKLLWGTIQSFFLLRKLRPDVVVGVGGYVSIPPVLAARILRIPVVLHEQNAVLGRANRMLAKGAKVIATTFPVTRCIPDHVKTTCVGLPVRQTVLAFENADYPASKDFNLLIFGGSQGARFFSHQLVDALLMLPKDVRAKMVITQQVRSEDMDLVQKKYHRAGFKKTVLSHFFDDISRLMAHADLLIGRGGASTITELMTIGRPGIIIPLPSAADNHQLENARQFCDADAGWLVVEQSFDAAQFSERILSLIQAPDLLRQAGRQAYKMARPDAAQKMAEVIIGVMKRRK